MKKGLTLATAFVLVVLWKALMAMLVLGPFACLFAYGADLPMVRTLLVVAAIVGAWVVCRVAVAAERLQKEGSR